MATRYRNRRDKDEHVLRLMTGIFMQRINSGLIKDALFCLPHWRTSRRLSWPCRIWARYEDNDARDVGWLYNKLMSELTDLGIKEEDPVRRRGALRPAPSTSGTSRTTSPWKKPTSCASDSPRRCGPSKTLGI